MIKLPDKEMKTSPKLPHTKLILGVLGLTYYIFWITDFHHHFGRSGGGNKKK
jgi:hypothetical protein